LSYYNILDQKVSIKGVLSLVEGNKIIEVSVIGSAETENNENRPEWELFSSEKWKYSLRYRGQWNYEVKDDVIVFSVIPETTDNAALNPPPPEEVQVVEIKTFSNSQNLSLAEWLKSKNVYDLTTTLKVGENIGLKISDAESQEIRIYLDGHNQKVYRIVFFDASESAVWKKDFFDLLGSFKPVGQLLGNNNQNSREEPYTGESQRNNNNTEQEPEEVTTEEQKNANSNSSENRPPVNTPPRNDLSVYTNLSLNYSVGYPKNWYYRGFGSVFGYLHTVGMTDQADVRTDNLIIKVSVLPTDSKPKGTKATLEDKEIYQNKTGSDLQYFLATAKYTYLIEGPDKYQETLEKIVLSIRD